MQRLFLFPVILTMLLASCNPSPPAQMPPNSLGSRRYAGRAEANLTEFIEHGIDSF
jgi:hypothetical protein